MAGDWIKMRTDLRDDPEVFALAEKLGIDRFSVVGRLHAFWSWWDEKSRNGRVDGGVTLACDDVAGIPGFGDAMCSVGWLGRDEKGLFMPEFEKHNGRAAKERAQGKQRQEAYRARNGTSNASVTHPSRRSNCNSVTREDKSSYINHPPVASGSARSQPPANPDSGRSTSTPRAAAHSTEKAQQQIAEQADAKARASAPPGGLTPSEFAKQATRKTTPTSFEDSP